MTARGKPKMIPRTPGRTSKPLGEVGRNQYVVFSRDIYSAGLEEEARRVDDNGISFSSYVCYVCTGIIDRMREYVMFDREPLCHEGEDPPKDVSIVFVAPDHIQAEALLMSHRREMYDRLDIRNIAITGEVPRP